MKFNQSTRDEKIVLLNYKKREILFHPKAYEKIALIVAKGGSDEIGWLGYAEPLGQDFLVTDVFVPKQRVHSATTEIDEDGLAEHAMKLIEEGEVDKVNQIRFWGHSHVNMSVSPSGQDDSQMEVFSKNCDDFFIRCIANKKGEIDFSLYLFKEGLQIDHVSWRIFYPVEEDLTSIVEEEIKGNVSKIHTATSWQGGTGWQGGVTRYSGGHAGSHAGGKKGKGKGGAKTNTPSRHQNTSHLDASVGKEIGETRQYEWAGEWQNWDDFE